MLATISDSHAQSNTPDHIILTHNDNPATTQSVTWRTESSLEKPLAQLALATAAPYDSLGEKKVTASTQKVITIEGKVYYYHSITFTNLTPNTTYRYRVGGQNNVWSAWNHFKTVAQKENEMSFLFLGDVQNDIYSWGTRAIWAAHKKEPNANFMLFAGDCVDNGHNDSQWMEWFKALGRVAETTPIVPLVGNHEYDKTNESEDTTTLSTFWQPQFELPMNGPEGLEESAYFIDYPAMRLIVLNSLIALRSEEELDIQSKWLESALETNTRKWTVVSFHHGLFSARDGRYGDYPELRKKWQPLFEKYKVDLVLTGHDHMYGRSSKQLKSTKLKKGQTGPVYVVSVSGPKMYGINVDKRWMERAAVNSQLYQVIHISENSLKFRTYTVTDELYDSFDLHKRKGKYNRITENINSETSPENKFPNGKYTNK